MTTHRRPLGPGVDREHQDVAAVEPHRPGRTAAELAALTAEPPAVPAAVAPTGRRLLTLRAPEDQAPSAG
ncbi:hypothetical protein PUR71_14875 [Streptomyces sp. SP17BM10]|uniref:hypothetical protein n=1 Tax=Streptomyces sp. SP17BM10 TaxID=3002530 RepID=UPI002E781EBE|nr:hypothetical protein [Streptomyces sp. SP17BM10]MEE1784171.1 hypothetical protein [Streptomyces sp. SP17BM10]